MKLLAIIFTMVCGMSFANAKSPFLTTYNTCTLQESVNVSSMYELKKCLDEKVKRRGYKKYPLYLYINSGGGSIHAGLRFISYAKTVKNLHTITEFAASMAAAIVQSLPGERYILEHGVMMFHRARGGFRGQFGEGELESRLKLWQAIVKNMEMVQAKRIGISLEEYQARRMNEWWLYSFMAVDQNTADSIVSPVCSIELSASRRVQKRRSFFGVTEYEVSDCPLVN
jgi:ATP-dependent protease ClpP protease subunit